MAFRAKLNLDDDTGTATFHLVGDLDSAAAPKLNELIAEAAGGQVRRMVLLMDRLNYMSSAGLRCIVFAHQKLGTGVEIVVIGARPEVADTIHLTGLDRSITMQSPAPDPADA